jgi:site-specific recombinase XerD
MNDDYIVSLRRELSLINYSQKTIDCYLSVVTKFLIYFKKSPEQIFESDIKDYILRYDNSHTKAQQISALQLFYKLVVHQKNKFKNFQYPRKEHRLPVVLSEEEADLIYTKITNLKHKCIFAVLYSTGIRIDELINLKILDIDNNRNLIRIEQGKGNKDRNVPLDVDVFELLNDYYRQYNPSIYVFNGQFSNQYSSSSVQQFLNKYTNLSGIKKHVHPHTLRHSCFTHMYENGIGLPTIQKIAGHKSIKTTMIYTHISNKFISKVKTPFSKITKK